MWLVAAATPLAGQPPGGETSPPTIALSPAGGTFYVPYAPTFQVTARWCDNASLNANTKQLQLNGVPVTIGYTVAGQSGCTVSAYSAGSITLQPGSNTVWAKICDSSGNCTTRTSEFVYATSDVTAPTVEITPGTQTSPSATMYPSITWCDGNALGTVRSITFNGLDVTAGFGYSSSTGAAGSGCADKRVSGKTGGPLTLQSGANTLTAEIQDVAGNVGTHTVVYTYNPTIDTSPTNQFSVQPQMFDAQLSWSPPSYQSLDQDRSVTLVYSSSQAWPTPVVQVDLTDNSSDPAPKASIQLLRNGSFLGLSYGSSKIFYATGAGTSRLVAWMEMPGWATGSYAVTAVITRYWPDGRTAEHTAPVRVLVVNEGASRFGAGWSVAGVERVVQGDSGIVVTHGNGSATFHPAYSFCSVINGVNTCYYGHTPGEFGTMAYQPDSLRYVRASRDGTKSYFDAAGQLTRVVDRLGNTQSYLWASGRLTSITDPAGKVTSFGYDAAGKLASISDPAARVSTFQVNGAGDLATVTGPDQVVALQPTYTPKHRVQSYYDRGPREWLFGYDDFGRLSYAQTPTFTAEGGQTFRQTTYLAALEQAVVPNWTAGTISNPAPRVNPATLRVGVTDAQGRTTRLALDPWGGPARLEDPAGYVSTTTRNVEGQVISTVDARGNATVYTWTIGDLTRVVSSSGTVNLAYDAFGQPTTISGQGPEILNAYNATTGVLDYSVVAGTDTTRYTYDTRGRVLTTTDPEQHVATYDYTDPSGFMNTHSASAGGRTTYYRYDAYGRAAGVTNPEGRETTFQYDVLNRQRYVTTPDAGVTEYVWGRIFLDRVTDARGQSYQWTRNAMGWVERETRPGDAAGVNLTAAYDRYGRTTSSTNRQGQQVSVTYDAWDRVSTRTADGQTTTFGFSPLQPANPTAPSWVAVSNPESTDTVHVDARGRLTSSISLRALAGGIVQRYELQPRYDALNRPVGLVVLQPGAVRDSIGYGWLRPRDVPAADAA